MLVDFVLRNGYLIDPGQNLNEIADVAVKNGRILEIGKNLKTVGLQEYDVKGKCINI